MYQDYKETRSRLWRGIAYLAAGLILLAFYSFLKKEKGAAGNYFAKWTGHIWLEWKILLFVLLPICISVFLFQREGIYWGYEFEELRMAELPVGEYASEVYGVTLRGLREYKIWSLAIFWLFFLFLCDLRYNKGSYRNSCIGKMAVLFNSRSLSLPVSKRMIQQTYGVFFLTIIQFVFFLISLVFILLFGITDSDGWIGSYSTRLWMIGILVAALALTAALLCLECAYQKKNKQMAADIELLSNRISSIHQGTYEQTERILAKDADVQKMSEELDEIRQGLETAVEERTRSERMKVELIANVSHDIKTPLTSIISYIQLLKQEEELPDYVLDYIRILDEKSERLKNMVQDVFTVSKAASGQLSVDLEELDLGKLIYQTLADMDEVIQKSSVTMKTEIPKHAVMVQADGQRMYRVFQNLIGNALKYSLEGSRVYITLKEEEEFASASVKNTSNYELNQETDFAERFTRGDQSRTDGGSGLGLSIAKSFTEACNGTFDLETNADLFVVTVTFRRFFSDI